MSIETGTPVQRIRYDYSGGAVDTTNWVQLDSSLNSACKVVEIFDSGTKTMELGIGASGSEVALDFYIMPGGNGRIFLSLDQGQRLCVRAVSATASTGELLINFYN